ncbi:VOC family protein [Rhodococcus sp. APC 3903]|uniref:VOC family protein n=1 Tax=Rhodococcus sp. APC 3903 TaxID=3035193 RepID=UPI0025B36F39|nr:VOC family protein [Rhodococcus sp. APC 3903]MDN3459933.1 VOC family protein [Rhodococcus sp. APC 3903]
MMLDAADHRRLAEFYRRLLGARYEPGSEPGKDVKPRFLDLVEPATGARLGFQVSENYQRPDWPDHHRVPTQGHLDISVQAGELDRAIDFAVSLGACVVSVVERDEGIVVLLDTAGHPFCFLTAAVSDESAGRIGGC